MQSAFRATFDGYYEDLPLSVVSKDPPTGDETSPQVYKLQGARFLGTPESEKSIPIKSVWLKQLADKSTRWVARTLYKLDLVFRIPALFALSSNLKINLTSIDGGARRRIVGCSWPVSFMLAPQGPFQRLRSSVDLKSSQFYTTEVKAGILYVSMTAFHAFRLENGGKLEVQPAVIKQATQVLLAAEYGEYLADFIESKTDECNGKDGTSKVKLVASVKEFISHELAGERVNQAIFDKSLDAMCTTKVPHGTTERLMKNRSRRYLKLKEPNGN